MATFNGSYMVEKTLESMVISDRGIVDVLSKVSVPGLEVPNPNVDLLIAIIERQIRCVFMANHSYIRFIIDSVFMAIDGMEEELCENTGECEEELVLQTNDVALERRTNDMGRLLSSTGKLLLYMYNTEHLKSLALKYYNGLGQIICDYTNSNSDNTYEKTTISRIWIGAVLMNSFIGSTSGYAATKYNLPKNAIVRFLPRPNEHNITSKAISSFGPYVNYNDNKESDRYSPLPRKVLDSYIVDMLRDLIDEDFITISEKIGLITFNVSPLSMALEITPSDERNEEPVESHTPERRSVNDMMQNGSVTPPRVRMPYGVTVSPAKQNPNTFCPATPPRASHVQMGEEFAKVPFCPATPPRASHVQMGEEFAKVPFYTPSKTKRECPGAPKKKHPHVSRL